MIPEPLQENFIAYVKRCLDAADQAQKVINELDELLETGFKGREVTLVAEMIHQLDVIEDDTDAMQIELRQQLRNVSRSSVTWQARNSLRKANSLSIGSSPP